MGKDNNGKYVQRALHRTVLQKLLRRWELEHEDIHAKYDNGVLTVTFPKEAKKKCRKKKFDLLKADFGERAVLTDKNSRGKLITDNNWRGAVHLLRADEINN